MRGSRSRRPPRWARRSWGRSRVLIKKISEGERRGRGWGLVAWRVSATLVGREEGLVAPMPLNLVLRGVLVVWEKVKAWIWSGRGLSKEQQFLFALKRGFMGLKAEEQGRRERLYKHCREGLGRAWDSGFDACNTLLKDKKLTDKEKDVFIESYMAELNQIEGDFDKEYKNV